MKNRNLSHKKTALAGACLLVALFIALGIFFYQKYSTPAPTTAPEVLVNQVGEINAWGEVIYTRMEDISVDFPSVVTSISVKEGERVALGQPLVTLDLSEYNGNIGKLEQQLAVNQAALPAAEQDIFAMQEDIVQTQNQIARKNKEYDNGTNADLRLLENFLNLARKEFATAESNLKKYQLLYDTGAVSEAELNQYSDVLDQRQKAVDDIMDNIKKTKTALKDELDQLKVSLKSKESQLSQTKLGNTANIIKQHSEFEAAQIDLDTMMAKTERDYIKDNQIISNIKNGIVQNILVSDAVHLGIQGTPTKVLQIIDADSLTISAEVDEEFIGRVEVGKTVKIVPTSVPNTSLTGTVTQIPSLAVEKNGNRVIRVLVKPEDPDGLLKPGYTADIYFNK